MFWASSLSSPYALSARAQRVARDVLTSSVVDIIAADLLIVAAAVGLLLVVYLVIQWATAPRRATAPSNRAPRWGVRVAWLVLIGSVVWFIVGVSQYHWDELNCGGLYDDCAGRLDHTVTVLGMLVPAGTVFLLSVLSLVIMRMARHDDAAS